MTGWLCLYFLPPLLSSPLEISAFCKYPSPTASSCIYSGLPAMYHPWATRCEFQARCRSGHSIQQKKKLGGLNSSPQKKKKKSPNTRRSRTQKPHHLYGASALIAAASSGSHLSPFASSFSLLYNSSSLVSVAYSALGDSTIASTGHDSTAHQQ